MEMNELREKAQFFFDKKIFTHIDTKDKSYYNGLIIQLNQTFLVISDRVVGIVPVAFSEIEKINEFREKRDDKLEKMPKM